MNYKKTTLDGFVLSSSAYQDKNAIVTFLTMEGRIVSVKVNGGKDVKSKNHLVTLPLNHLLLDVTEIEEGKMYAANSYIVKDNYTSLYEDITTNTFASVALEVIARLFVTDEVPVGYFSGLLQGLAHHFDGATLLAVFLAASIRELGVEPETDGCVNCGRKNDLVSFSWEEGGFLCASCASEIGEPRKSLNYLKIIRYLFLVKDNQMEHASLPKADLHTVLLEEISYLEENFGVKIKSTELLKSVLE